MAEQSDIRQEQQPKEQGGKASTDEVNAMSRTDAIEFLICWVSFYALIRMGIWAYFYYDEDK